MSSVIDKLKDSNRAFLELVWPVIASKCGGGQIRPVEVIQDNDICRDLDVLCGIDVWQTIGGEGCRGIASRVQWDMVYQTFTIRSRKLYTGNQTEYHKRFAAIKSNGRFIFPYLTSHAYVNRAEYRLIGGALARTEAIFDAIERGQYTTRRTNDAEFIAVQVADVEGAWPFPLDNRPLKRYCNGGALLCT